MKLKHLKHLFLPLILLPLLLLALPACKTTPQKAAVNSLAVIGHAGNDAYDAYLQSVFQGTVPTNDVPKVTALYRQFQASYSFAASAAHFATNATLANPELMEVLNKLQSTILTIQKGK